MTVSDPPCRPGSQENWNQNRNLTRLHFQRPTVDLNVEPLGGGAAEVLEHAVDSLGDVVRHRLVQLHPAVHHHTAIPEIEDFELLEAGQIGLQVRQKLRGQTTRADPIFHHQADRT